MGAAAGWGAAAAAEEAALELLLEEEPALLVVDEGEVLGGRRTRSPRMVVPDWITVRPPRIMLAVPWIWERREILLPVSVVMYSLLGARGRRGAVVVGGGGGAGMVGVEGVVVRVGRGVWGEGMEMEIVWER